MAGQQHYYQPLRDLAFPDPFQHHDYFYSTRNYWGSYSQDTMMDEDLDSPVLDNVVIDPMRDYVEYGDDCIDAGPTSFPENEYYPSEQEMLRAQEMVQTVCPSDLLLDHSVPIDNVHTDLGPQKETKFPSLHTMMDANFDFDDATQPYFAYQLPETTYSGFLQQLPAQVRATSEDSPFQLDDDEMDLNPAQVADSSSPPVSPQILPDTTGQVKLIDGDGEEYDAWTYESILDSRKVAKSKGGIEYLVKWTGYANPTWQPARDLRDNLDDIMAFHDSMAERPGPPSWVLRAFKKF